jgi:hypothetical protein
MAAASKKAKSASASTADTVLRLTTAINEVAANNRDANGYEIRNALLLEREKARVRYENGITLPTSAKVLLANALRTNYNHRRRLSTSIVAATGQPRPDNVCAHHVVAVRDRGARVSRIMLFDWGIGINDADNGVFLPQGTGGLPDHPNAPRHDPFHSAEYHAAVLSRLLEADDSASGRVELRGVKADLLAGSFPL